MKRFALAIWLMLLLTGLGACNTGTAAPTATPEGSFGPTSPTVTPLPSANTRRITIATADGETLVGTFYPPPDSPAAGVLLLHMLGHRKEDWAQFATRLQETGYGVLALDLRGHGESGGERNWTSMPDDVQRAWTTLVAQPEVDRERTGIVGADIGANLALLAAGEEAEVRAVVLLSPGLDYHGIRTEEAMTAYGARPLLVVASQEDTYAATSAQALVALAQGPAAITLYTNAGHGTDMFGPQPDLVDLLLSWLEMYLE